jgi:hypothetical protein
MNRVIIHFVCEIKKLYQVEKCELLELKETEVN